MKKLPLVALALLLAACAAAPLHTTKAGLVEYAGAQKTIFETGKAEQTVSIATMTACPGASGVGAVAGLDGEITVYQGRPYITKIRGDNFKVLEGQDQGAVFAVWTCQSKWREETIPSDVKGYVELQDYVKARAAAAGIDIGKPFAFQLSGTPAELKWHVNLDLSEGRPITSEIYAKSKANFVLKNQAVDIVGFYSENHPGVFISALAPAIKKDSQQKNAIHIHLVTKDGSAAGHIDNLTLAPGMTLRLPQP